MQFTGTLKNIVKDWETGQFHITFTVNEEYAIHGVEEIKDCEKLAVEVKKYRSKRSLNANGLLWHCLGEIATSMNPPVDKWEIYLQMLKRYGKYTYICIKPSAVDVMKAQWRESEVIGEVKINGQTAVQMLCYFGSSLYNTKEFSVLLEGVISEMKEMGLEPPTSKEMQMALERWEKLHEKTF